MEIYILIGFIWVIGWLYASGVHSSNKEAVRALGNKDDMAKVSKGGWLQYVILFFGWPHYLGYGK